MVSRPEIYGLLVPGAAQQTLRGTAGKLVWLHLGLGVGLARSLLVPGWLWWRATTTGATPAFGARVGIAGTALVLTVAVGFAGAKMVYAEGAGVDAGRQYAQTDRGASLLAAGLATNADRLVADYWHFLRRDGLWPCTPSRARPRQSAARCASRSGTAAGAATAPPGGSAVEQRERRHHLGRHVHERGIPAVAAGGAREGEQGLTG